MSPTGLDDLLHWARPEWLWALLPWALAVLWFQRRSAKADGKAWQHRHPGEPSPWAKVIDPALLPALLARAEASAVRRAGPDSSLGGSSTQSAENSRASEKHELMAKNLGATQKNHPASPKRTSGQSVLPMAALGALLILALAGPQLMRSDAKAQALLRPDAARVLLVDLSPAFDAQPEESRQRVRNKLRRFVRGLPAGETALVVVAGEAWLLVPPTEDGAVLDAFLSELSSAAVPIAGDAPEKGLALARRTLAATGARQKDIFWLRMTENDAAGSLLEAQSGAAPKTLQVAASVDDWLSLARQPAPSWQASLLNRVSPADARRVELGPWLALLALPLAAMLALRPAGRRAVRRRPGRAEPGLLLLLLAGGLGSLGSDSAQAARADESPFEQGAAHYRAGRYAEAAAAFAQAPADDPRTHYNRANALARSGRLKAALAAYDESLRLRPDDPSTRHNREIVARLLQPPSQKNPPPPGAPPPKPPRSGEPPKDAPKGPPKEAPNPPPNSPPDEALTSQSAEAARAAEQWLRRPPGDAAGLLKRKLALEEARRKAGAAE